ncbi:hypothetical protein V2J09_010101 [Rumex salicifolius]
MDSRLKLAILCATLLVSALEAKKAKDPYKVLGVDRNASQREIQKAFHKLSLQYHPDKNKNKGAQEKFEEINNAYELLSDEDKRKNYDLYGDEKGGPFFDGGNAGSGQSGFSFRPDEWQNMGGGQGKSNSFSFSFGGPSSANFGFGLNDIFSQFFGGSMDGGSNFGGSGGSTGSKSGGFGGSTGFKSGGFGDSTGTKSGSKASPRNIHTVTSQSFEKEINNKGVVWLLAPYTPSMSLNRQQESVLAEVATALKGALKFGKVNCGSESTFCKNHSLYPRRTPRIFVYSYIKSDSGSFVEYTDEWDMKSLKSFCNEHLPRFSSRVKLENVDLPIGGGNGLPEVMLLSSKKDTPVIWRALSGLYRKRLVFYDAQVNDASDPKVKKLGVDALPAVIGWLSNGEKHVLKTGIKVKDLESAVQDLSHLFNGFEKKNKKVVPSQSKKTNTQPSDNQIPVLSSTNADAVCSDSTPVCVIGVFRSSKSRKKLESILSKMTQKTLSRKPNFSSYEAKDSVSYLVLDATKQQSFLNAFDKSGFKSSNEFLLAFKPRRGKYAVLVDDLSLEEVEKFVGSVLSGDVQFSKARQRPAIK